MKLSILIPTFARPDAINCCINHLAAQDYSADFEIIIGLDGPNQQTPDPILPISLKQQTQLLRLPKQGLIRVRQAMLKQASGDIILWLNDDAYPTPNLLQAHMDIHAQHARHAQRAPCIVAGRAHWKPVDNPNLFDTLVQRTDLIFFQPHHDTQTPCKTDYRNCFGLNMSFPRKLALEIGGLHDIPESYGYEDIELAHRLIQAGAQAWHAPTAVVTHDHRYTPLDVLKREYLLGRTAWHFAKANTQFAQDLFGRNICSNTELEYITQALKTERQDSMRIERSFLSLAGRPIDSVQPEMLDILTEHWILLKRYLWKWGLSDSANGIESRWTTLFSQCFT